jgi:putative oxidoreductase
MLKKLFAPGKDSAPVSVALFALRVWLGLTMLLNHGLAKLTGFSQTAPNFPDPLGVGHTASLALSVSAEFFASLLLILGLVTRLGALVLVINMSVAFFIVLKGVVNGNLNGELAFLYLAGYVTLLIAGPGRLSADKVLFGKKG